MRTPSAATRWSPGPIGASRSPTEPFACWCCCTFDALGYTAVELAFLFLFYEFFGMVTNLLGGWTARPFRTEGHPVRRAAVQIGALKCWRCSIRPGHGSRPSPT